MGISNHFRLKLLGKATLTGADGRAMPGLPKKAFLVAAIIAGASGAVCAKSELAELLWPDLPPAKRTNNLRQLLFRVRQFELSHSVSLFVAGESEVGLAGLGCDLLEFEEMAIAESTVEVERLLAVYAGRLLEGASPRDRTPNQWLADRRRQIEDQFVDMLLSAVEDITVDARKVALGRAIGAAPAAIGPRKALMRQLISDGLVQEARRQYREIENIAGHGSVAAPPELTADTVHAQPVAPRYLVGPVGQSGRDQAGVPHVALLPPRGGTADEDTRLVAEGVVDDVTVALTRLRSLSVLAAHTARKVADGEDHEGTGLARADFVLRTKLAAAGSRGRGGSPRLTLFLERASSGDVVWADGITIGADAGPMQFAAIANGVALTLVDQIERATLRSFRVPADAGAYGHYLLGQKALQVLDLPSTRRARASFKAAFALSPDFAPAHTGYAQSMIYEWIMRGQGESDLLVRARRAAERASEIDPLFGSAYQMLGRASLFEGDFNASLEYLERAEALNPHHADLLCDFADTLMHSSLAQRANDKIELALKLNPLAPDAYWWASAGIKFFVGEYEGALTHLSKVRNSEPVLRLTAACAAMAGRHELAKVSRNRFLAIDPGFRLDDWIGVLPVRDPSHRRQYRQALQKAGFK